MRIYAVVDALTSCNDRKALRVFNLPLMQALLHTKGVGHHVAQRHATASRRWRANDRSRQDLP